MRLTGFVSTNTRDHRKTLRLIFENAKNKNLLKIKRINTEIQANTGGHFLHFACQGGAMRIPAPPSVTPLLSPFYICSDSQIPWCTNHYLQKGFWSAAAENPLTMARQQKQSTLSVRQRWDRIRITGVDSGRILHFSFGPGSGPGVKNLWKTGPGSGVTFPVRQ